VFGHRTVISRLNYLKAVLSTNATRLPSARQVQHLSCQSHNQPPLQTPKAPTPPPISHEVQRTAGNNRVSEQTQTWSAPPPSIWAATKFIPVTTKPTGNFAHCRSPINAEQRFYSRGNGFECRYGIYCLIGLTQLPMNIRILSV
jgi:hypothetical protein